MTCPQVKGHGKHTHSAACGHTKIQHGDHVDYVHGGHLHREHAGHWDACVIEVSAQNPDGCRPFASACGCCHDDECGHELVPHGDHFDYLCNGRLHHRHGDHCDDHGPVTLVKPEPKAG